MKKGIALVLGGEPEEGETEEESREDGIVIASELIRCIAAKDAVALYDALCALEDHLHMYREEEE